MFQPIGLPNVLPQPPLLQGPGLTSDEDAAAGLLLLALAPPGLISGYRVLPNARRWCGSGERQSRYRPSVRCEAWRPRIRGCGETLERPVGGNAPGPLGKEAPAVLSFMRKIQEGLFSTIVTLGGGEEWRA